MLPPPTEGFDASYRRAQLLFGQRRFADAAEWFQRALESDPNHAMAMAHLASSWIQQESTQGKAVEAARRAVALDPENAFIHAVLAICLIDGAKPGQGGRLRKGLESAETAVTLDPDLALAHSVKSHGFLKLHRYAEAEDAARQALALDLTDTLATQVLSMALLGQRKDNDLKNLVEWQLQENPEDDSAHVSAGFRALHEGRYREANDHFREALRIDPSNGIARLGLVEAYRARSFIYRWLLQFSHFMRRFGESNGRWIMIGGYIVYRIAVSSLQGRHPALTGLLVGTWLTFALWSFLARGIASCLMLTDRFARLAIQPKERWEGIVVGSFVLAALATLAVGITSGSFDYLFGALVLIFAAVPNAVAFSNDHHLGKWLYAAAAVVAGVCALTYLAFLVSVGLGGKQVSMAVIAIWIGIGTTWMTGLGVLYR